MFAHALPKLLPDVHDVTDRLVHALSVGRTSIRQASCAIAGHDYLLHLSGGGIRLRCADCGRETPGWKIEPRIGRGRG